MEKDYISRERLKKEIDLTLEKLKTFPTMTTQVMHMQIAFDTLASMVNDAPAADVVAVVRCKDCKNWETDWALSTAAPNFHYCGMIDGCTQSNHYCSYGERKDDA